MYTAAKLAITVQPTESLLSMDMHILGEKGKNSVPKLLGKIQLPGLLYTCWVTV